MKKNAVPKPHSAWNMEAAAGLAPDGSLFPSSARHEDRRRAEGHIDPQTAVHDNKNKKPQKKLK